MEITELELADFNLVEIKTTNECAPTPHCKKHGAMNKITSDGIWRCLSIHSISTVITEYGAKGKIENDCACRAGCFQVN